MARSKIRASHAMMGQELLNKRYDFAVNILTPAGLVGNTAPPRTYGVSAGFEF